MSTHRVSGAAARRLESHAHAYFLLDFRLFFAYIHGRDGGPRGGDAGIGPGADRRPDRGDAGPRRRAWPPAGRRPGGDRSKAPRTLPRAWPASGRPGPDRLAPGDRSRFGANPV